MKDVFKRKKIKQEKLVAEDSGGPKRFRRKATKGKVHKSGRAQRKRHKHPMK